MSQRIHKYLITLACVLSLVACNENSSVDSNQNVNLEAFSENVIGLDESTQQAIESLLTNYLIQIDSDYSDANDSIIALADAIDELIASPETANLEAARQNWLDALNAYELTVLHRYFADFVLDETSALSMFQLQYQINHWPILPGYIDYVAEYPESGIVNDMTVTLEAANLRQQHGEFDINEAVTGLHVIEFLLWGENKDGIPRQLADFEPQLEPSAQQRNDGLTVPDLSNNRRRLLLSILANIASEDIEKLRSIWSLSAAELRREFLELEASQLLLVSLDTVTSFLTEELLVKSLYPMLNGDYLQSLPATFSRASQNIVSSQLFALERFLLEVRSEDSKTLDELLTGFSTEYAEFFLPSFDASKECLVVLYSSNLGGESEAEFKVVECINLVTNMIDYLEQIKISLTSV